MKKSFDHIKPSRLKCAFVASVPEIKCVRALCCTEGSAPLTLWSPGNSCSFMSLYTTVSEPKLAYVRNPSDICVSACVCMCACVGEGRAQTEKKPTECYEMIMEIGPSVTERRSRCKMWQRLGEQAAAPPHQTVVLPHSHTGLDVQVLRPLCLNTG